MLPPPSPPPLPPPDLLQTPDSKHAPEQKPSISLYVPATGPPNSVSLSLLIYNGWPFANHWEYFIVSPIDPNIGVVMQAAGNVRKGFCDGGCARQTLHIVHPGNKMLILLFWHSFWKVFSMVNALLSSCRHTQSPERTEHVLSILIGSSHINPDWLTPHLMVDCDKPHLYLEVMTPQPIDPHADHNFRHLSEIRCTL
ncbi:hypothetical protein QBC40DRAFT_62995 [Triangularia verruculosa]|uniref:Uncharacterized protein n=1 Tax=Triangularia verruculosa TaxID=2587418 RepID=A0AAN6XJ48_9PEZI|nr:hypothetical protein QBC40DRAFT_62995 [Triangularia verruculosa]